jgi:hypothetical protein
MEGFSRHYQTVDMGIPRKMVQQLPVYHEQNSEREQREEYDEKLQQDDPKKN